MGNRHIQDKSTETSWYVEMYDEIKRIIIVGEDFEFVKSLARHLKREGFHTDTSENALQAFSKIKISHLTNNSSQLIITDILTSKVDNFVFVKWIKKDFPKISILAVANYGEDKNNALKIRSHLDAYCTKPLSPLELLHKIDQLNYLRKEYGKKCLTKKCAT